MLCLYYILPDSTNLVSFLFAKLILPSLGTYIIGKRESREVGSTLVRLKDESQWVKIPHHHAAIISKGQFEQAQKNIRREKCVKKNTHPCLLSGKVYCGCCQHRMQRIGNKSFRFHCKHRKSSSRRGLRAARPRLAPRPPGLNRAVLPPYIRRVCG